MSQTTFEDEVIEYQACDMRWWGGMGHASTITSWFPRSTMWTELFETNAFGVAIPLKGGFRRKACGVSQFVDRNLGFFRKSGEEVCVAHVTGIPDESTIIEIDLDLLDTIDARDWQSGAFVIDPELDLQHRILLRDMRSSADELTIEAGVLDLVRRCLGQSYESMHGLTRRRLVDRNLLVTHVCELLHNDQTASLSLIELAREVGYSPFHLSRVFSEELGVTLSQYRMRLRVRDVVDRLEQGEQDLAALAMDTGFADHSHMTRTVVAQLGIAPSSLRSLLRDPSATG